MTYLAALTLSLFTIPFTADEPLLPLATVGFDSGAVGRARRAAPPAPSTCQLAAGLCILGGRYTDLSFHGRDQRAGGRRELVLSKWTWRR